MKKLLILLAVIAFMCLSLLPASASTGYRLDKTNVKIGPTETNGGNLYFGTINVTGALSGTYSYVYSSGLFINAQVLSVLSGDLGAPYSTALSNLNPGVGMEWTTSFFWDAGTWGTQFFQPSPYTEDQATNLAWMAQNVVPGRTAGWSGNDQWGAENTANITGDDVDPNTHSIVYDTTTSQSWSGTGYRITQTTTTQESLAHYSVFEATGDKFVSPLVLDMTGKGTIEASNGKYLPHKSFDKKNAIITDFFNNGFEIAMEWVGPNDGLLVAPKADGSIDTTCLFGSNGGFENGFEKLSLWDKNNDNKITGDELNSLSVWQDKNQNGRVDNGELTSLKDAGVTSISLMFKNFEGSYTRNGKTCKMWDWWPSAMELKKVSSK